jgi:hypothetical protein
MDRFEQKLDDIGRAKAEHIQQILKLSHQLLDGEAWEGVVEEGSWSVAAEPEPGKRKGTISVSAEDLEPVREVHVSIKPMLEQEKAMAAEQSERLRRPGTDGWPMMSDKTLRRDYIRVENPDEEEERIEDQMMRQRPEVQEMLAQEWMEKWQEGKGKEKAKKAPPGPQEYECPVCGFRGMSEESMVGQLCPNCQQGKLQLVESQGAGLEPATSQGGGPGIPGAQPLGGYQQTQRVPGLPSQFGGGAGQPPPDQMMQALQQMGGSPPIPRR